jgi:S1/P1 Nuclease
MKRIVAAALTLALSTVAALAWGDDGNKVVALIAEHYLTPTAKRQVDALLAADTDNLTAHDIASEATWADKYRNKHRETASWHFVDLDRGPRLRYRLQWPQAAASRHAGLEWSARLRGR